MRSVTAVFAALLLAACGRDEPQSAPAQAFRQQGVDFKLEPQATTACKAPGAVYRGTVRWTVPASSAGKPDLEIRLRTPDGQVFLSTDKASGSAETGDWVEPGLWFLLLDHRQGEAVAAFQAGPSPCR
jgi:hypothetical protein